MASSLMHNKGIYNFLGAMFCRRRDEYSEWLSYEIIINIAFDEILDLNDKLTEKIVLDELDQILHTKFFIRFISKD